MCDALASVWGAALPGLPALLTTAALFAIGDVAVFALPFRRSQLSVTWTELAVVHGLVVLPDGWPVLIGALTALAVRVVRRRPVIKIAFNVSVLSVGCWFAAAVVHALGVDTGDAARPDVWVALATATLAYATWTNVAVAAAVAASERVALRRTLVQNCPIHIAMWFVNTVAGIGTAVVWQDSHATMIVLPYFLLATFAANRGYVRARQDRDIWRRLENTSRQLARLRRHELAAVVLEQAADVIGGDFVELLLVDDRATGRATLWRRTGHDTDLGASGSLDDAATFWPRAASEREPFEVVAAHAPPAQQRELDERGLERCVVIPIEVAGECIGTLRVGFARAHAPRPNERRIIDAFRNQLALSADNAWLYEEMREERAKLSRVVDNTSDGILSVDSRGHITSWNPAMARISGLAAEQMLGCAFTLGHAGEDDAGVPVSPDWLRDRLGDDAQVEASVTIGSAETGKRYLHMSLAAVRSPAGDIESVVVVARDVTALRDAAQAKEEFLATVSHELRTPLTSLRGWVSTLLRPDFNPTDDIRREIHGRVLHQADRLHRLVEDVLCVSALERGDLTMSMVRVDAAQEVELALQDFRRTVPHREVRLAVAAECPPAIADPARLRHVVSHLLANAVTYSGADEPVDVRVVTRDGSVVVSVTDRGRGIPADRQERIFERFSREGAHLTRAEQGVGVGLHIAAGLVGAMGGRIEVASRVGEGSTFSFTLPVDESLASGVGPRRRGSAPPDDAAGCLVPSQRTAQ